MEGGCRTLRGVCASDGERMSRSAPHQGVPTVSRFRGITIYMYHDDHEPPHFHARHAGTEVKIAIHTAKTLEGDLRRPQIRLVRRWAALHRSELLENWDRARAYDTLRTIQPPS